MEFWPVLAVGGAGLLAWGELRQKVKRVTEEVDSKVSKDTFQQVDTRMERIERQVDKLVDTLVDRN